MGWLPLFLLDFVFMVIYAKVFWASFFVGEKGGYFFLDWAFGGEVAFFLWVWEEG